MSRYKNHIASDSTLTQTTLLIHFAHTHDFLKMAIIFTSSKCHIKKKKPVEDVEQVVHLSGSFLARIG